MNFPGMPPLLNQAVGVAANISLVSRDIHTFLTGLSDRWGIYQKNVLKVQADAVVSFEFRQEWRIPNYPMEEGAFQSYNRVQTPFIARVMLTRGGTGGDRNAFLKQIEDLAYASPPQLVDVVTREKTYSNVSIDHIDYRRTADHGTTLLSVELYLIEIRTTAITAFANTAAVDGLNPVSTGLVLPAFATVLQSAPVSQNRVQ